MMPGDGPTDPPQMSDGEYIRWLESERRKLYAENERLREALAAVLVETNFISLQAARSYITEVLAEAAEAAGGK